MSKTHSVEFTEEMKGFVSLEVTNDYKQGHALGKRQQSSLMFRLTIKVPDVELFEKFPGADGTAVGYVDCPVLGGRLEVVQGMFNCFVNSGNPSSNMKQMRYRLFLKRQSDGKQFTLSGHKLVKADSDCFLFKLLEIWPDTSTLYTQVFEGFISASDEATAKVIACGVLRIAIMDFIRQLFTFKASGDSVCERVCACLRFGRTFARNVVDVYFPSLHCFGSQPENTRPAIPRFTHAGVPHATVTTYPVPTADEISVSMLRFQKEQTSEPDDVVMLLHGLSTSTDMFIMPEHKNLVTYLHEQGFTDVWSLDWRGSMRHPYNTTPNAFNLDDVALFDIPAAVAEIRRHIGPGCRLHVICHCVGSLTFMMSLYGKAVTDITSVVSNSIALVCRMPWWSSLKLKIFPFGWAYILRWPTLNPNFATLPGPGIAQGKIFAKIVSFFHPECDVPACHMCSMMWGAGQPAMWQHENLSEITHRRTGDLFGAICGSYFWHIRLMRRRGVALKKELTNPNYAALPNNYLDWAKDIKTPTLFVTGGMNKVFADSNIAAFEVLNKINPGNQNELFVVKGYGHQDVFMGKNDDRDTFPTIVNFLRKHSH